jgi:hypothetical protein
MHQSPPFKVCDSPDQAAHYHVIPLSFGLHSLPSNWLDTGKEVKFLYVHTNYDIFPEVYEMNNPCEQSNYAPACN